MPKQRVVKYPVTSIDGVLGKNCKKCGEWKSLEEFGNRKTTKDGKQVQCKVCERAYGRSNYSTNKVTIRRRKRNDYQKNAEKERKRSLNWYHNNKERARASHIAWLAQNPDYQRLYDIQWKIDNRERATENVRRFRENNPAKMREYARKYYAEHPDVFIQANERRRARKRNVIATLKTEEWMWMLSITGRMCLCCGRTDKPIHKDHIIPLDPGTHTLDNIQPLCKSCNSKKRRKTIDYRPEWMKQAVEEYLIWQRKPQGSILDLSATKTQTHVAFAQT